jgi:hypothetical protein
VVQRASDCVASFSCDADINKRMSESNEDTHRRLKKSERVVHGKSADIE